MAACEAHNGRCSVCELEKVLEKLARTIGRFEHFKGSFNPGEHPKIIANNTARYGSACYQLGVATAGLMAMGCGLHVPEAVMSKPLAKAYVDQWTRCAELVEEAAQKIGSDIEGGRIMPAGGNGGLIV